MALAPGTRLGPYEIGAQIGVGGMGIVYRATDTNLKRPVAIKVLPDALASDAERLARFQREAEVLASLNHPNVAAIYGLERTDMTTALVLELVEGPTLADRLVVGPIPIDEAFPIARQICEALEAAHEHGIVHRDLKPANIKVRADGTVKVLDFGLAKALEPAIVTVEGSQAPTIASPAMTEAGVILGTAAYMSPEQAKGKTADKRSDIWAFGCVLYEMLTGTRAFPGDEMMETLASVVRAEPDWPALPAHTPSKIRTLVFRCLQKDMKKRTRDAGDIVIELDEALAAPPMSSAAPATATPVLSRRSLLLGLTALVLGGLVTGFAVWRLKPAPAAAVNRFTLVLPPGQRLAGLAQAAIAFSPDGRRVVHVASAGGPQQLYLREMDSLEGKPIPGTEGAANPFFSPDGRWVGFFTNTRLKRASLSGGPTLELARVTAFGSGGSWGSDGNIIFASFPDSGLSLVSEAGGPVQTLTRLGQGGERSHRFPHYLPGGGALLFTVGTGGSWDDARIEALKLGSRERTVLIEGGSDARYVPTGHVVFRRRSTLMAVPVDLDRLRVTGSPVALVEGLLGCTSNNGCAQATLTDAGSLLYLAGSARPFERTLAWVNRAGIEQPLQLPSRAYGHPSLSPDDQRVALTIDEGNHSDVWVYDVARANTRKLTVDGVSRFPLWTSDGKRVTFQSNKVGATNLFWITGDGTGEERLTASQNRQLPGPSSPDGETLAFTEFDPTTQGDIWTLSLKNRQKAEPFVRTPFNEFNPTFSADGRFVAYQSDRAGRLEIYVQPFPGPGSSELVSTDGGTEPIWSRDGQELFYRNGDQMLAVATTIQPTFHASKPEILFEIPDFMSSLPRSYDVTSDGQRFLLIKESEQVAAATRINVVLNWQEELKRLVPSN